jgi:hypothetical protein
MENISYYFFIVFWINFGRFFFVEKTLPESKLLAGSRHQLTAAA